MINPLNQKVEPKEYTSQYEVLPKGTYEARVFSIGDWKGKEHQSLKVFEFDDNYRKVQDADGKDKFHMESNVTTYSSQIVFEVTEGTFKGARVYYYLNLHPNQPWGLPAFLSACNVVDSITPLEVPEYCKGSLVSIYVDIEQGFTTKKDPVTGVTIEEPRDRNVVKKVKAIELQF